MEGKGAASSDSPSLMVRLPKTQVHAALTFPLSCQAFPQWPGLRRHDAGKRLKPQNWAINCAQTAIIPTNSPIDANAAASSTKTRNMTCLHLRTYREHSSVFVLTQAAGSQLAWKPGPMVN